MFMPFGKYRDQPLADVPTGYLRWLLTIDIYPTLRYGVEQELESRKAGKHKQVPAPAIDVATWYRQLSLRFHPDRGGSKEAMQAINVAKELLEKMLL